MATGCPAGARGKQGPPPPPRALTMRSGGGVLRMKHLIWPFSPWRACWVWVLEMMGGPAGKRHHIRDSGEAGPWRGPSWVVLEVCSSFQSFSRHLGNGSVTNPSGVMNACFQVRTPRRHCGGVQNESPQHVLLCCVDYVELKAIETLWAQETPPSSLNFQ